jgi:MFS family permease
MSVAEPGSLGRDARIIGLVASGHFLSHFFQLTLPPLFPVLREEFGVGYAALGLMMTLFYAVSSVGQTVSGFLVDRVGARRVLVGGLTLYAVAIALAGLSPSYVALVPVMLVASLGNSVFHPADYAIFNAAVDPSRLGRAFSIHGI